MKFESPDCRHIFQIFLLTLLVFCGGCATDKIKSEEGKTLPVVLQDLHLENAPTFIEPNGSYDLNTYAYQTRGKVLFLDVLQSNNVVTRAYFADGDAVKRTPAIENVGTNKVTKPD